MYEFTAGSWESGSSFQTVFLDLLVEIATLHAEFAGSLANIPVILLELLSEKFLFSTLLEILKRHLKALSGSSNVRIYNKGVHSRHTLKSIPFQIS